MLPVKTCDLNQVAQSANKLSIIGFAKKPAAVLMNWAAPTVTVLRAAFALVPLWMFRHGLSHFVERHAIGRVAEVKDGQALWSTARLQKAFLQRLPERMNSALALLKIAQAIYSILKKIILFYIIYTLN
jgi:hypothetical protein